MTDEALQRLIDEVSRLQRDVAILAGEAVTEPGIVEIPVPQALRRLERLSNALAAADRVDDPAVAVIGRRVAVREPEGDVVSFALVLPGDGDPSEGWISAESPLGTAVLGRRTGDVVRVEAPAGSREVTLVSVG